jgi:dTDP-4-dehydrorhamnose reductase
MKRVWVVGSNGQLGFYLCERLGDRALGIQRAVLDLSKPPAEITACLDQLLATYGVPSAVLNTSAYTAVDKAEQERELCRAVNVQAPQALAAWCQVQSVPFVHYSTDYVYPGSGDQAWRESDATGPLNYYGESKLQGEVAVLAACPSALVFRTAWVYSHFRDTFVRAILKKAASTSTLSVVGDQVGSPTSADELAKLTLDVMNSRAWGRARGVFNLTNSGFVARDDFARAILTEASRFEAKFAAVTVTAARTADYPSAAPRPLNSRLDLSSVCKTFALDPKPWRESLRACIGRIYANH